MTRARRTLTLARFQGPHPFLDVLKDSPTVLLRDGPAPVSSTPMELRRSYRRLGLGDVFLSYAGYRGENHPVHSAIAGLSAEDMLQVRADAGRWELLDQQGIVVGQLASDFHPPKGTHCAFGTVSAVVGWEREYSEPEYQRALRCNSWEVVVPELVFEPDL